MPTETLQLDSSYSGQKAWAGWTQRATGLAFTGSAWATRTAANLAAGGTAATFDATGYATFAVPALVAAGDYDVAIYSQAGATPAAGDVTTPIGIGNSLSAATNPGGGAWPVNVLATSDGTTPIPGATMRISGLQTAGPVIANGSGVATFALNPGTVTVSIGASGYSGAATITAIDSSGHWPGGTSTLTMTLTATPALPTPGVNQCTVYLFTRDLAGNAVAGVAVQVKLVDPLAGTDAHDGSIQTYTSDVNGRIALPLRQSSSYAAMAAGGSWRPFTTGTATPAPLSIQLLGKFEG